jgi:hypothetical protein
MSSFHGELRGEVDEIFVVAGRVSSGLYRVVGVNDFTARILLRPDSIPSL